MYKTKDNKGDKICTHIVAGQFSHENFDYYIKKKTWLHHEYRKRRTIQQLKK